MARYAPDGVFHTRFTVVALRRGRDVALIDAGLGPGPSAYFGGLQGGLDRALAALDSALALSRRAGMQEEEAELTLEGEMRWVLRRQTGFHLVR